jgi:hypothetical protein
MSVEAVRFDALRTDNVRFKEVVISSLLNPNPPWRGSIIGEVDGTAMVGARSHFEAPKSLAQKFMNPPILILADFRTVERIVAMAIALSTRLLTGSAERLGFEGRRVCSGCHFC